MVRFEAWGNRSVFRGMTILVLALAFMPVRGARAACTGDCNGDGEVTVNELLTMVNIALGTTPLSACTAGDADADGDITVNEIVAAVNNALTSCPVMATPTSTPVMATPTPTPTLGLLGLRHFVMSQARSEFRAVLAPGNPPLSFPLGGFQGQTDGQVGPAFLDLEAGAPDSGGFATINVVGASEYLFVNAQLANIVLCIKPIVPVSSAGVIACNGDSGLFSFALTVNHHVGQVGVDGFTVQQCTSQGGSVESPNQICDAGMLGQGCRANADCDTAPGAGDGGCGLSPSTCSEPESTRGTACRADAECDPGADAADGVCGRPQPHPGVCNSGFQAGALGGENGPGTVTIAPVPESGLNGLPVELSIESDPPCGDEGPGQSIAFALTSAKVRGTVLNFSNDLVCSAGTTGADCRTNADCDTHTGAGDGVCGETLTYETQGQNFSCSDWQNSSGPGCLVLSAPALDQNPSGGDIITVFKFCAQ